MTASVNYVHAPCASERIITSCCGERCFRHEAVENERLGICGYCAARNPTATDHCDRCGERFYFRLVTRTRDGKWLCRSCQEETLRDRFSELESELIALGSRAFTVAPEHVRRELEQGCYAGARLLERLRGVLAQAKRGWVPDVLVALPEESPPPGRGRTARAGNPQTPAVVGANFTHPESRARRLLRNGFEPFGRHGWWARAGGPSMRPSEAVRVISREFQSRAAAWFQTKGA